MMRNLIPALATMIGVCLFSSAALGAESLDYATVGKVTSSAALNGTPNTGWIDVRGYSGLRLEIDTVRTNYTNLSYSCVTASTDQGVPQEYTYTKTDSSDVISLFNPTFPSTAALHFAQVLNVGGYWFIKCTFAGAGATGTDLVTVTGYLTRGY